MLLKKKKDKSITRLETVVYMHLLLGICQFSVTS